MYTSVHNVHLGHRKQATGNFVEQAYTISHDRGVGGRGAGEGWWGFGGFDHQLFFNFKTI